MGLNQESREELEYLFQEWEMEQDPTELIGESMAPVRQAVIGPMLVGRELEELCWGAGQDGRSQLTAHPDWLKEFRDLLGVAAGSLTLHQSARIERTEDGFIPGSITAQTTMRFLPGWKSRGFRCPQRTSGPTCAAADVGPCSHGEMG